MKKITLLILLCYSYIAYSQKLLHYDEIKLDNAADYKTADSFALTAANYLLSSPLKKDTAQRLLASHFLIKWMAGTPDYSFSPDAALQSGQDGLIEIYLACLTKYCLENKNYAKNKKAVKLNSIRLLLTYCGNPDNNIKMSTRLRKLEEANEKGELEKALQDL